MSDISPEEIKHQVKTYIKVFIALGVLTVVTVAISYFHLPVAAAVGVALLIAAFKSSLVAAFFMHLAHEKPIVLALVILAILFFVPLLLIPMWSHY